MKKAGQGYRLMWLTFPTIGIDINLNCLRLILVELDLLIDYIIFQTPGKLYNLPRLKFQDPKNNVVEERSQVIAKKAPDPQSCECI